MAAKFRLRANRRIAVQSVRIAQRGDALSRLLKMPFIPVLIGIIAMFVLLSSAQPAFLKMGNIINIFSQCSLYGIMAVGMVFVISLGEIDISVGMSAFFVMTVMYNLRKVMPAPPSFALAILTGTSVGILNGILVCFLRIPSFLATLGTMSLTRGLAHILIGGTNRIVPSDLQVIGGTRIAGIVSLPSILMIVIAIIGILLLSRTRFGRYVLAIGGSVNSARDSGIPVNLTRIAAFAVCGFCVAVAAIVFAGRIGSIQPDQSQGYEFVVITAVILGGTKLMGGRSSVLGAVLGCIFLYLIENALTMLQISGYYQDLSRGIIFFGAIAIDTAASFRQQKVTRIERAKRIYVL